MAPPRLPREVSVDGSPEQEAFFEALRAFHEQRGYVEVHSANSSLDVTDPVHLALR